MTEDQIKYRLTTVVLSGSRMDMKDRLDLEAQYFADKFGDKEAEKRWIVVAMGFVMALLILVMIW